MRKVLLTTSAIAIGAASTANAAEWEINLGGYMEQTLGYASYDSPAGTDFDGVDLKSDQEFYFRPSITLDNGIRISARLDFEGADSGGVDEPRMIISGSFGSLTLGEDDLASYDVTVTAPDVTFLGINSGSSTAFQPGGGIFGTDNQRMTRTTLPGVAVDPVGVKYFTPRFAGFQVGVSYARDSNRSSADAQVNANAGGTAFAAATLTAGAAPLQNDIFGVGANYTNTFGDFGIAASAGWSTSSVNGAAAGDLDTNPEAYGAGLNLSFAGFTIGGSWAEGNDTGFNDAGGITSATGAASVAGANDGRTYDVGVSYETGPWGFSFTYLHAERGNAAALVPGTEDEIDEFLLGVNYDLAQGVRLQGFGLYTTQDSASAAPGTDNDGFVIGTGVRVDF